MSEDVVVTGAAVAECPGWCTAGGVDEETHAHVGDDVVVETLSEPIIARLVQVPGSDDIRALVSDRVATVQQLQTLASALMRLVDDATPADPGLGFVAELADRAGASVSEMAMAAGIDVARVRAQRSGGQVLSVREFDRLALAVAQLAAR